MTNPIKELKNIFIQIGRMFRVKKNEVIPSLSALAVYIILNALIIMRYYDSFSKVHVAFWKNWDLNTTYTGILCSHSSYIRCIC